MPGLIAEVAAIALLAGPIAGPPAPTPRALPTYNGVTATELRDLRREIGKGRDRGELSRKQTRQLRREASEVAMLEQRYAAGGLSDAERAELRARVEVLRVLTRRKRSDAWP